MNFYSLKSIVAASKTPFSMSKPSLSFHVAGKPDSMYIEPKFTKEVFDIEKPAVILVSAAGSTGKSALANTLSYTLSLPLLDLSKHKPVGDNTLTGLIAESFDVNDLSKVLAAIQNGTYGIIIDGIDEGRAKVTEQAFDAFLDDIVQRCRGTASTSFVLLGRTNVLEYCWLYLMDKGISTGLISIQPFDLDSAKKYIDTLTGGKISPFAKKYESARDEILSALNAAFPGQKESKTLEFLPFIGYPPVLDAIATLFLVERDYHQLHNKINLKSSIIEIELLTRICSYILNREREQKVHPNFLTPLIKDMPVDRQKSLTESVYSNKEQCQRLVSLCLNKSLKMQTILETPINEKYEEQLSEFIPEHPFISKTCFRNAVFESFALATLMVSNDPQCVPLVLEYANSHKNSYYLIYFLSQLASSSPMPDDYLRIVLGAAYEFRSSNMHVDVQVDSSQLEGKAISQSFNIEAEIEIGMMSEDGKENRFELIFKSNNKKIYLGRILSSTYIWLPVEVILSAPQEIELIAPVYLEAESISLLSNELIVRNPAKATGDGFVDLVAKVINSSLTGINFYGAELQIVVPNKTGLTYPILGYAIESLPQDTEVSEKYLRLKRILVAFRAHGRGKLARLKAKIENPHVLRNETGKAILKKLLSDNIITIKDAFYFLDADRLASILGISWQDLRANRVDAKVTDYLKTILI